MVVYGNAMGFSHRMIYKHGDNEFQGFVGVGTTPENAINDAFAQVVKWYAANRPTANPHKSRCIEYEVQAGKHMDKVREDWFSYVRLA